MEERLGWRERRWNKEKVKAGQESRQEQSGAGTEERGAQQTTKVWEERRE